MKIHQTIHGISSASGLIWKNESLYIISDNSDVLYVFQKSGRLNKISLLESGELMENRPKPEKSDYEAITEDQESFYIFGSGSTPIRNRLAVVSKNDFSVSVRSLDSLYLRLKSQGNVDDENFNIEGAIIQEANLFLFNRGNGPKRQNGIFEINNWKQEEKQTVNFHPISLPPIQNSGFGFTDAVLVEDKIYFLAAAEAVASTYEDGEILGSIIGRMDFKTFTVETTQFIPDKFKLEGITLFKKDADFLYFLICEDPDDGGMESEIFELKLPNSGFKSFSK